MRPLDPTRHHADGCYSEHVAWDPDGGLAVAIGVGRVPARGKYAPGDWIVIHGRPGAAGGHLQHGMRGMVLGGRGGGYYYGITDDGRPLAEPGGVLMPDGQASRDSCTCCPLRPGKPAPAHTDRQLDLFPVTALFGQGATAEHMRA